MLRKRPDIAAEAPLPTPRASLVSHGIELAARREGFALDPAQVGAARVLADAAERLSHGESPGVYLWGPVGRGKTWLVDAFLSTAPVEAARRFHFHRFFRLFHEALGRHRPPDAVRRALDDLVGDAQLLCFDELYAHETGDAQLFTVILRDLRERRRLPMVVTSNYPPDGLLPDAEFQTSASTWEEPFVRVRHEMFLEGIDVIKRSFEIVSVDAGVDYREIDRRDDRGGFASGTYAVSDGPSPREGIVKVIVEVRDRRLAALSVEDDAVTFDFSDLCSRPVGASDVAELAERFRSWKIVDVPKLSLCTPEAAQRFVNFVDVLCDADVRLDVISPNRLEEIFDAEGMPPDIERLKSRLRLLRAVSSGSR